MPAISTAMRDSMSAAVGSGSQARSCCIVSKRPRSLLLYGHGRDVRAPGKRKADQGVPRLVMRDAREARRLLRRRRVGRRPRPSTCRAIRWRGCDVRRWLRGAWRAQARAHAARSSRLFRRGVMARLVLTRTASGKRGSE